MIQSEDESNEQLSRLEVESLLQRAHQGEAHAVAQLLPLVYRELRALAQHQLGGERPSHTLQATALVHEAYLRLLGRSDVAWDDHRHFFHAAGEAIRRILVDHARARGRLKRGGDHRRIDLGTIQNVLDLSEERSPEEILALEEAFRRLEERSPRYAAVVRFRFFAGLSVEETARAMGVSERTVNNDWLYARAWLARELQQFSDKGVDDEHG